VPQTGSARPTTLTDFVSTSWGYQADFPSELVDEVLSNSPGERTALDAAASESDDASKKVAAQSAAATSAAENPVQIDDAAADAPAGSGSSGSRFSA
jgi:hypothetical protein